MSLRVDLRHPLGERVLRDVVDGMWAEPSGSADEIVGEGSWALPGLVDAHAHLAGEQLDLRPGDHEGAARRAKAALAAGVMLILDKGWSDSTVVDLIATVPGAERPDIEAAARIVAVAGGYYADFALEIDPSTIEDAVTGQAVAGAGWVKLVGDWPRKGQGPLPNFTESQLRAAVAAAEASGAKVAIHTMAPGVPSAAVAAGVHSIEHGLFLAEDDLPALGARGGMWVPTVARVEAIVEQLGPESGGGRLLRRGLDNVRRLIPLAVEAGVRVLTGTDMAMGSEEVAAEALRLAEYGLGNDQAIEALSGWGLEATGRAPGFEVGAPANAVLFPDDPADDLRALLHPARAIRMGTLS